MTQDQELNTTKIIKDKLYCKKCNSDEIVEIDTREGCTIVVTKDVNSDTEIDESVEENGFTVEYEYKCQKCDAEIDAEDIGVFSNEVIAK